MNPKQFFLNLSQQDQITFATFHRDLNNFSIDMVFNDKRQGCPKSEFLHNAILAMHEAYPKILSEKKL
jgi:hypothetical protein